MIFFVGDESIHNSTIKFDCCKACSGGIGKTFSIAFDSTRFREKRNSASWRFKWGLRQDMQLGATQNRCVVGSFSCHALRHASC